MMSIKCLGIDLFDSCLLHFSAIGLVLTILLAFLSSVDYFLLSKLAFSKHSFRATIRMSSNFDPDQNRLLEGQICVKTVCRGYQQSITSRQQLEIPGLVEVLIQRFLWLK